MPEHPTWSQITEFASKLDDKGEKQISSGICIHGLPGWGRTWRSWA